jgi:hypothetical protein
MTPLGLLNFVVLQWFGVRLQASYDDMAKGFDRANRTGHAGTRPGRWYSRFAPPRGVPITWSLRRWIWPLTGWWSEYSKIRWTELALWYAWLAVAIAIARSL